MSTNAVRLCKSHPRLVAAFVIVLARMAAHTDFATHHPTAAVLVLLWLISDATMLALMAGTPGHRPGARKVLGTLAGAGLLTWVSAPAQLHLAIAGSPLLMTGMIAVVVGHFAVGCGFAVKRWRGSQEFQIAQRLEYALREIVPVQVIRLARAELQVFHIAVFNWRGRPDVPSGCQGFDYHRHLAPQMWVLLFLMTIEAAAEHILMRHWNSATGIALAVVGDICVIYGIGLTKSLRLRPVLLTRDGVRVRVGILTDQFVPYDQIAGLRRTFSGDDVRADTTWNMGLLAWPNTVINLKMPIARRSLRPGRRVIKALAFRLDEPEQFQRQLDWRMATHLHNRPDTVPSNERALD